jgi:predicted phosphodiesterase
MRKVTETKVFRHSLAVIADIHGNRWALEAVLQDIDRRGIQQIVNLGDHLTGPLNSRSPDQARHAEHLRQR